MWRKGILFIFIVLAVLSLTGYLYLTEEIASGTLKIAAGKKQLVDGEALLAKGKARLSEGQGSLSQAKTVYHGVKSIPLMNIVTALPVSGTVFSMAHDKIHEGNTLVEQGQAKIKSGEAQLSAGKDDLRKGEECLKDAKVFRLVCGFGSIVFSLLSIIFGFRWKSVYTGSIKKRR